MINVGRRTKKTRPKLTKEISKWSHWRNSGILILSIEHIKPHSPVFSVPSRIILKNQNQKQ